MDNIHVYVPINCNVWPFYFAATWWTSRFGLFSASSMLVRSLTQVWRLSLDQTNLFRVPTRTGKPGKMGRHFPVREKSGNFEQTGKVRENHKKYWKTQGIWDKFYLIFLVIFKWTVYYLLKWIKFSVKKK